MLLMRRWGNEGAVANAMTELVIAHETDVTASVVAHRVEQRDTARAAASLSAGPTIRAA